LTLKSKFKQLASCKITTDKSAVVSEREDGAISIVQKINIEVDNRPTEIFLKNAIVTNVVGLDNLIDALTTARRSLSELSSGTQVDEE